MSKILAIYSSGYPLTWSSRRLVSYKGLPLTKGRLISAHANFHTLHKSEQCSPNQKIFSQLLVPYQSSAHKLSVQTFPYRIIYFLFGSHLKRCIVFFRHTVDETRFNKFNHGGIINVPPSHTPRAHTRIWVQKQQLANAAEPLPTTEPPLSSPHHLPCK